MNVGERMDWEKIAGWIVGLTVWYVSYLSGTMLWITALASIGGHVLTRVLYREIADRIHSE